jgi:hypothetical protein
MRTVAEYRTHADKCRELANLVTTPIDKKILEEIAQSWEKLADLRKRDREPEGQSGSTATRRGGLVEQRQVVGAVAAGPISFHVAAA